jgi:hypothetical protein
MFRSIASGVVILVVATHCFAGATRAAAVSSNRRPFVTNYSNFSTAGAPQQIISANLDGTSPQVIATPPGGSSDIDFFENQIYWTESRGARIRRASVDGSNAETIFQGSFNIPNAEFPIQLAIDPIKRRIVWTNQDADNIMSANLDGTDRQTVNIAGLDTPYAIGVDHLREKIYWSEFRFRSIFRANLDGSDPELIVQDGGSLPTLEGIALDIAGGKIYWTNRLLDKIQRANLDGSGVETIVVASGAGSNFRDIEIDPISGKLYWVDDRKDISDRSYIYRSNPDGSNQEMLMELVGQASGLAIGVPEPTGSTALACSIVSLLAFRRRLE